MKKIIHVAGLLTAGAATVCSTSTAFAQDSTERWTIGGSVKGFYDDNIYTRPNRVENGVATKQDSFGVDIVPSINLNLPMDQTFIGFGAQFGARWFESREDDQWDYSFIFNGNLNHQFNPRVKLDINESFALAQEPEQLAVPAQPASSVLRAEGDNIRNNVGANLSIQFSEPFNMVLGFQNNIFDYDDPGYAAALNRIEYIPSLNFRFHSSESTVWVAGYQLSILDYSSDDLRADGLPAFTPDNMSHYLFGGVDHSFNSRLMGSLRAGAQITDYDFVTAGTETTPYFDGSLSYTYHDRSTAQLGVRHTLNATDVSYDAGVLGLNPTLNQEATAVYAAINHAFSAKFTVSGVVLFQTAEFNGGGGGIDGDDEQFFSVGVTANYKFNHWLSAEANYYYDDLSSDIIGGARAYNRNRVFAGLRVAF